MPLLTTTVEYINGTLITVSLIMVLGGLIRNLCAKKRTQAVCKAVSSGTPNPNLSTQTGEVIAIEHFPSVLGLPGYLPPTFWRCFLGNGTEMELLFTRSALLFCDPSASESLKRTSIPYADVISARTDYNLASNLIIKSKYGTIYCDTHKTLGAKPVKKILETLLRDQSIKASQNGLEQQEGFQGYVSPSNIIGPIEQHQPTSPPPLPYESQNLQIPAAPPPLPIEPQNLQIPTAPPPETRKLHTSPPQPCSGIADQGRTEDGNINHLRKITKDSLHDDSLLGISSDMPTEEISNHLNTLFRKYSGRISHDDPKIAAEAKDYLKRIGEARARYIGVY